MDVGRKRDQTKEQNDRERRGVDCGFNLRLFYSIPVTIHRNKRSHNSRKVTEVSKTDHPYFTLARQGVPYSLMSFMKTPLPL